MSQNLVDYQAMQRIVGIPFDAGQSHVLKALAEMECHNKPVRRSQKRFLNEAHKSLKYKLDGPPSKLRVHEPEKIFILLQVSIGQLYLAEYSLRQEMNSIVDSAFRVLSAAEEYSVTGSKHGNLAFQSLKLRRSPATGLWGEDGGVLNQLRGVGPTTTPALKRADVSSFHDVLKTTEEQVESCSASTPFGSTMLREADSKILECTLKLRA